MAILLLRLIGTLLAEQNVIWQERRYLDMDEIVQWAAECAATGDGNNVVAITENKMSLNQPK